MKIIITGCENLSVIADIRELCVEEGVEVEVIGEPVKEDLFLTYFNETYLIRQAHEGISKCIDNEATFIEPYKSKSKKRSINRRALRNL